MGAEEEEEVELKEDEKEAKKEDRGSDTPYLCCTATVSGHRGHLGSDLPL